jgi:hypothetical protein
MGKSCRSTGDMQDVWKSSSRPGPDRESLTLNNYENQPQLLRKGKCAPHESPYHQVFFDYGWSAILYVDLLLTSR